MRHLAQTLFAQHSSREQTVKYIRKKQGFPAFLLFIECWGCQPQTPDTKDFS